MTNLLIVYVATFFLPLLFHSWRVAVLALGGQGLLLALILVSSHEWSDEVAFEFVCLVLIRGVFVPRYLLRKARGVAVPADFSLIAKGLPSWTLAFALLIVAFAFGHKMSPADRNEALEVGAAAASVLLGMLVLASQTHPVGQLIGLFTFEGGVTLLELLSPHAMPFPVRVGASLASVALVVTCGQYLGRILAIPPVPEDVKEEIL